MNTQEPKVLFMHGLDSSRESTKFQAILSKNKYCINVDYRNLKYAAVERFYIDMIEKIKPDILVGHSLGGYWALKMSNRFQLPAVIANPSLMPSFDPDYPAITIEELQSKTSSQIAYIELGDELIDMHSTSDLLEPYMYVESIIGGRHQLENPDRLNYLIGLVSHSNHQSH
ncbi:MULTISPECIES: YqiA/YcfP family alpha/beta fold hydrolase [unclassified Acinetobacter]|uniref:YqiA/YcfP family alpha/beta fold hydrolase n=1 Tax=unclassified Acinetobacter TaxID=196816 RepID=UPI0015D31CE9|nr:MULTISPECIES: YqiA/YcfP family alpha/beta fold hydrolase [unclassified Acinetobacter]